MIQIDSNEYLKRYTLIILLILLVPTKEYVIYFLVITLFMLLMSFQMKVSLNIITKILLIFILYLGLTAGIRFFFTFEANPRDFMEIYRFVPLLLIFIFFDKWKKVDLPNIIDGLFMYLILDGLVSILQIQQKNIFGLIDFVAKYYNAQNHYEISLLLSNRALGLSAGPGQHATVILVIFIIFLCNLILGGNRKFVSAIGSLLGVYVIFLTQSRSAFLVMLIVCLVFILIVILFEKIKGKLNIIIGVTVVFSFLPFITNFVMKQRYLSSVFLGISNNSSYMGREEKWSHFLELMQSQPTWFFIGHGKDFFGQSSGAMDNEYLYIGAIYGISILIIFLISVCVYLVKKLLNWRWLSINEKILFFILVGGIGLAWPSAFFTDPHIMFILSLLSVKILDEKEQVNKNNTVKSLIT